MLFGSHVEEQEMRKLDDDDVNAFDPWKLCSLAGFTSVGVPLQVGASRCIRDAVAQGL